MNQYIANIVLLDSKWLISWSLFLLCLYLHNRAGHFALVAGRNTLPHVYTEVLVRKICNKKDLIRIDNISPR